MATDDNPAALLCYVVGEAQVDVQPATRRRAWMDETERAFAYRCLPLTMANTHGWEIRCAAAFEAEWNGGNGPDDVRIIPDDGPATNVGAMGHFGHGILSFSHEVVFRTPEGFDLWVAGPANSFKDAIAPLSGLVEADWMPFTFSMNWRFTRTNTRVRFEKGEPYCQLFPVPRGAINQMEPVMLHLEDDAELRRQYEIGKRKREFRHVVEKLRPGFVSSEKMRFQGWYARGVLPDESRTFEDHQLPQQSKPFRRA